MILLKSSTLFENLEIHVLPPYLEKICKRIPDLMAMLSVCTRTYREVLKEPSTSSHAADYGSAFCSNFWPDVYKCMRQSITANGCSNEALILAVLNKHAYMCKGKGLKRNIKNDFDRLDSQTLLRCKGYLDIKGCRDKLLFPPIKISWTSLSFEEDIEALQTHAVNPTLDCIAGNFIAAVKPTDHKPSCLDHKRALWMYFTLGLNQMGMFGVYSEPRNFPDAIRS
ncbi:hypothetical protein FSP39_005426 [Pinctada imbricata]|uniref:Uncharacterized protein n=1 Tax=Pinctada imbricata TaxID=66713 RepID=A0AA88Y3P2_PINIB|nr:hypothetical protein FSP39_005426 [Pinctada imbricata]